MTQTRDEGVLSRWSRRKQQSSLETEQEDLELETQTQELDRPELNHLSTDPIEEAELPALTDADMPAIESLTEKSDFSGFMSSGVSDELRNLALRKLFSAPSFNIRDGLDEYDEDYTYFEKLGDIVTSDMKHQMELEELAKKEQQSAEALAEEIEDSDDQDLEPLEADSEDEDEILETDPLVAETDELVESVNHNIPEDAVGKHG